MLSRRNIRIKVLQALYMMGRDPEVNLDGALTFYRTALNNSQELYLFNLWNLIKTTELSIEDTERKRAKYLPSEEDKKFSAKLHTNPSTQSLVTEVDLQDLFTEKKMEEMMEEDSLRTYYKGFAKKTIYQVYVSEKSSKDKDEKILLSLYKHMIKDELFQETMDDHYPTWEDDKSLIIGAMKKTIKALPDTPELYRTFRPDYEVCVEFGENLLSTVVEDDKALEAIISPALENWDIDRVANIDMILLKMALCEFLNFSTIPTKVTLNEYVEISKQYSTDKSKDFVNGILDRLLNQLNEEGKITKTGRGLVD